MSALILNAIEARAKLDERIFNATRAFSKKNHYPPKLATILVGDDPSSKIYIQKKAEACKKFGFAHIDHHLSSTVSVEHLKNLILKLNADPNIHAILIQKPLPIQFQNETVFEWIHPQKDVDCFHPFNIGKLVISKTKLQPCTPAGVIELLNHFKMPIAGKNALIIGRSDIVGKPLALLLLHQNASVTIAHSRTENLNEHIQTADFIFAAIGKTRFLDEKFSWKKSAVVVDVGISRLPNGKIAGDVDFENVKNCVSAITPVPGGVGPMTIGMLMWNTLVCASLQHSFDLELYS